MRSKIRVGITGVGSLLGQGIVRALKKSRVNHASVGLCLDKYSTGLYWTDEYSYIYPAKDANYIEHLIYTILQKNIDILLIGTDVELPKIAAHKWLIEQKTGAKVLISSADLVSVADDKYLTANFFKHHGVPYVRSTIPGHEPAGENQLKEFDFPLIVKPRQGARSKGVLVVDNAEDLKSAVAKTPNPVIQEHLGDSEHEYTASAIYFDGLCRAHIVMRRHLRDGNTYRAFVERGDYFSGYVQKWCEIAKPFGPINFQFRCDGSGVPKVFEINARFSGTTPLRALAGFNEVEMCVNYLAFGQQVEQPLIESLVLLRHWEETAINVRDLLP